MNIHLPQRICADPDAALRREWLVTNGVGGFASGTVAGALTRRYHGLLLAALSPPVGRTLLVAKLDETATVRGREFRLYTNVWQTGIEEPAGCRLLRRFDLVLGVPVWTFDLDRARLVKRVWMEAGRNLTFVQYELDPAAPPVTLTCRLLVNHRSYHHLLPDQGGMFQVCAAGAAIQIHPPDAATPTVVGCAAEPPADVHWQTEHTWCHGFHLPVEAARGFDHLEDHLEVGRCTVRLGPGGTVTFTLSAGVEDVDQRGALDRQMRHAQQRLDAWSQCSGIAVEQTPTAVAQLVLAADQFVVARPTPEQPDGHTLIAGYPWFTDWGRDTMISLPGLTLVTGRFEIARQILRTWAGYVDQGLIPNRFPDRGDQPEYHTADATLWYLWAIDQYVRATGDVATLVELFPVMREIVDRHRWGTRHNIRVGDDGLVHAGEEGVNLTWMDAKIGDRVITPRMGKPVELSALWYDALCNLARLADLADQPGARYAQMAETTRASFARFWNPAAGCCFDVLDGPSGNDPSVRPNQILAVSLTHSPLVRPQQQAVVQACERKLLTWFGLRSLAPSEPGYRGRYVGGPVERDEAYHQGTAWGWLLGPFVLAHYRVHRDAARALQLLQPMLGQLWTAGVGSLSEIFDGDEPHAPNGCPAQAWSVAETLRAWQLISRSGRSQTDATCATAGHPRAPRSR
jgi:predicted glycogen debranching enzyme